MTHHFRERLLERYGIEATDEIVDEIVRQITSGESTVIPVPRQQPKATTHQVTIRGMPVTVVYLARKKGRSMLITALPLEFDGRWASHIVLADEVRFFRNALSRIDSALQHGNLERARAITEAAQRLELGPPPISWTPPEPPQ